LTKKEIQLDDANHFMSGHNVELLTIVEQAEMCKTLQTRLKLTRQEIADVMGLTRRQVETRLVEFKNFAAKGLLPTGTFPVYTEDPQGELLKDEVERITRLEINRDTKIVAQQEIFEERLTQAIGKYVHEPRDTKHIDTMYRELKKARPKSKRTEEVAVALQSDSHFGLVNSHFNDEIAKAANDRFIRKVIRLTELHRSEVPVKTIHYVLNGDNIQGSGANFPNQRWSTDQTAVDQMEMFIGIAVENIENLLLCFDNVVVDGMPGNHGYIASKKTNGEPDHANFETIAHRTLRWIFRNNKRVSFNLTDEWYQVVDIGGRQTLITHGHSIPGAGSLDGILATFRRLQSILPYYDDVLLGHFHRTERLAMSRVFGSTAERTLRMGGTMVLGDEFSEKMGASHTNEFWMYFNASGKTTAEYVIPLYEDTNGQSQ
jgi:hypothetical protein